MQAAVGLSQLKKLPGFIAKRRENFAYLRKALRPLHDLLILPEATEGSDPSWFGFAITLSEKVKRTRLEVIDHLEKNNIATRLLFGGNLIHQPAYQGKNFRVVGTVPTADIIMNRTFWIGLYPAIDKQRMDYMAQCMKEALRE
jgi:CDP-6-deoxy-D-xylo-4-hexulose-3-dehydrase